MPLIPIEADEAAVAAITGGLPPEVRTFCDKHGIVDYLEQGVAQAYRTFSAIEHLEAEIERDPETGEEWVVLRIAVRASEEEVAEARKRYSAEWVASVPWPQRHLICLSCHIL
jgi:hypothetical protein